MTLPQSCLLAAPDWPDYELLDTGNGQKLERFGPYKLVRPETQAIWSPALPEKEWQQADALFQRKSVDDASGVWTHHRALPTEWALHYDNLTFLVRLTPFRHTGIFPEHSAHWPWMRQQLMQADQVPHVLVLFGYTGLTTLFAARCGAHVCHVDASRPAVRWAQANQVASGLAEHPIRWIVDDVRKFVQREIRRGSRYDMIVLDPPVFGRGPKGEIWRLGEALPELISLCVQLLTDQALGVLVNAYATSFSAVTLYNVLAMGMRAFDGHVTAGELILIETGAHRALATALYARWGATVQG